MMEFTVRRRDRATAMRMLRRYLRQHSVDTQLGLRVTRQAEHGLGGTEMISDADVTALSLLQASLRAELHYNIFGRYISRHPLFRLWADLSIRVAQEICGSASSFTYLNARDQLFSAGSSTNRVYHAVSGRMVYWQSPESSAVQEITETDVEQNAWMSEASLWTRWTHVGTIESESLSQVLCLDADAVIATLSQHKLVHDIAVSYGRHFHKCIVFSTPPRAEWPTDLLVEFTSFAEIVLTMEPELQTAIGFHALTTTRQPLKEAKNKRISRLSHWAFSGKVREISELMHEVETGASVIISNPQGGLERLISLVVARIERDDGHLF